MGGGLVNRCVGCVVYGADVALRLKTTAHPKTRCRKQYAATDAPDDGRMYPKHVELRIH